MTPKTLIIRTAGTNCDRELAHAFEVAGATAVTIHLNRLMDEPYLLEEVDLIGLPGGFSYGDDIAAGRIFANQIRHRLFGPLCRAVRRGVPVIGICNGFQVLVKLGLLPDPPDDDDAERAQQQVTLGQNTNGRFIDCWVDLTVDPQSNCIWTRGLDRIELPIAHGEGRFVVRSPDVLDRLRANGQVVLRYTRQTDFGEQQDLARGGNPNGSMDDIAGICDRSGLVLGLMPHPERYTDYTHHPQWSRERPNSMPHGLRMIRLAVEYVRDLAKPDISDPPVKGGVASS